MYLNYVRKSASEYIIFLYNFAKNKIEWKEEFNDSDSAETFFCKMLKSTNATPVYTINE